MNTASLLSLAKSGDVDALRTLLERFGGQVWSAIDADIAAPMRSLIDADDVMQVTYMEAFLQVGVMAATNETAFQAWLHRIASNNLRDAVRELQRKKRPPPARRVETGASADSCVALLEFLGVTTSTPSRQVARQECSAAVDAAMTRLPADYAMVIRLYDLEERSIEEVAAVLGRSAGAVHMLRMRAHAHLRVLLSSCSDFLTRTA